VESGCCQARLVGVFDKRLIRGSGWWGRRVRVRSASAVVASTRVTNAEMEARTVGALATERLAERGARSETPSDRRLLRPWTEGELGSQQPAPQLRRYDVISIGAMPSESKSQLDG